MWGQTKSIAEIKAKIAQIRAMAAEHDVDDETLEGLYPQLLKDIDRAEKRKAEDNKRQIKRNAVWDASGAAASLRLSPAQRVLIEQQKVLDTQLEAKGHAVPDKRQRALAAEDAEIQRQRKQKWKAWHDANQQKDANEKTAQDTAKATIKPAFIKAENDARDASRRQFWATRTDEHVAQDNATQKERVDNWDGLTKKRAAEDNKYQLAIERLKRANRTTFFKDFSHGCNKLFYRNIQSGYRHTGEFFATTGRTLSRAGTWVAAHARECKETVSTGLNRAGTWLKSGARYCFYLVTSRISRAAVAIGKFTAECASTTKRTFNRATTTPFQRMGDGIVTAAIAVKRKFQDLNPVAAYDRLVEEDMLMNVDQDIIEENDGENIGQRFGLFRPAPVAPAPRVLPPAPAALANAQAAALPAAPAALPPAPVAAAAAPRV
jgi:hypothetical protein